MARLSAPANVTPRAERKSSRFREIFKHRPSSSASSSPDALTNSLLPPGSSPMPIPTMPPGFRQVGLLPSERSSHSSSRLLKDEEGCYIDTESTVAEARRQSVNNESATRNDSDDLNIVSATPSYVQPTLPKSKVENSVKKKGSFSQSMRRVLSQRSAQNTNQDIAATRLTMSERILPTTAGGTDKRSSVPLDSSQKIAEAMYNKDNRSFTEGGIDHFDCFVQQHGNHNSPKNSDPAEDASPKKKSTDFEKMLLDDSVADLPMSGQIRPSVETAYGHVETAGDGHSSHRKSFASNVFHDDRSLSQSIREYVTSKIAEVLAEHDRAHRSNVDARSNPSVHITIRVDGIGLLEAEKPTRPSISDKKDDMSAQPSTIGPVTITSPLLARNAQMVVLTLYAVTLLGASLSGPRSLLIVIWRMAIALGMYTAVLQQLSWTKNVERDVFLAPIFFFASVATGMGEQLLNQVRVVIIAILVEILDCVVRRADVRMHTK
ncbi:hypothetical protein GT037_008110 [Alternaria burnsii]|uniref:Uncharacterized protein n=1 Tax=Alternaria burnsii TaxID=1187904 RepID=A0A8H7EF15_9PLEO|nr:uncharacterized protein GT037_008110 [Alternaria burnsii]KAF7673495.1 hypothetical protein GT037_008110 [Alternaria burnsii]